jgi:hypothetical protein
MTNFPTLYQPATEANINEVVNVENNSLQQLQTGVKPFAPNYMTQAARRHNETTVTTFYTFPTTAHLWSATLAFTIVTAPAYTPGITKCFADLSTGSGIALLTVELGVAAVNDHDSNTVAVGFNGIPVAAGDTLVLNINNGTTVPNLNQQATAIVGFATP